MNDHLPAELQQHDAATVTQRLARHAISANCDTIAPAVLHAAKLFMLDTLAVSWAGSDAPGCRETHGLVVDEGGRADATAWVYGGRLPVTSAAFINGMTASALDYDSIGHGAAVHINIAVLPAALAMAERRRVTGKDFLAALIAGSDIMYRLAAATQRPNRGFHFTAAIGVFGAAAAAARLLGLDAATTQHALGIAFMQSSGTQQANIQPSLSKRMLSAFAARSGVYAALLAGRGITAPSEVIEGKFGLYQMYQPGDTDRVLAELGHRFDNVNVSIKRFPSCGCNHTAIEATLDLVRRHDLKPEDVSGIEVTVTPYIDRIVGGPYDPGSDPQVAAQFNIRYSIACALVRRKLGLAEIQEEAARDPRIAEQIPKVQVRVDPEMTGNRGPVVVRMRTRTHGELTCRIDDVSGRQGAPIPEAEIEAKFRECFGLGVRPLSAAQIEMLMSRVHEVEQFSDMSKFFEGICA